MDAVLWFLLCCLEVTSQSSFSEWGSHLFTQYTSLPILKILPSQTFDKRSNLFMNLCSALMSGPCRQSGARKEQTKKKQRDGQTSSLKLLPVQWQGLQKWLMDCRARPDPRFPLQLQKTSMGLCHAVWQLEVGKVEGEKAPCKGGRLRSGCKSVSGHHRDENTDLRDAFMETSGQIYYRIFSMIQSKELRMKTHAVTHARTLIHTNTNPFSFWHLAQVLYPFDSEGQIWYHTYLMANQCLSATFLHQKAPVTSLRCDWPL